MNGFRSAALTLGAFAAFLLMTGCQLAQPSAPSNYYVLGTPAKMPDELPNAQAPVLAVDEVVLPSYLRRSELATRNGNSELRYRSLDVWAEPLEEGFARRLRLALSVSLPKVLVTDRRGLPPGATVSVYVDRFEADNRGQATLAARVLITHPESGQSRLIASHRRFSVTEAVEGSGPSAEIEALGKLIDKLAANIAQSAERYLED